MLCLHRKFYILYLSFLCVFLALPTLLDLNTLTVLGWSTNILSFHHEIFCINLIGSDIVNMMDKIIICTIHLNCKVFE